MAHAPMPWVKLYTSRLDDVRFNKMPETLKWRWAQLTMLAGKLDAGGTFVLDGIPLTDEEIAWHLRLELTTWQQESQLLKDSGYLLKNGRGWQLTDYLDTQGPDGIHAEKRAQWRERQERHRNKESVTGDKPVSHASKSQSQSQSQESESRVKSQSVITRDLLKLSGVPIKYHDRLTDPSADLTIEDFLAELARNYAKIGSGPGQVKNPPLITAMNLCGQQRPAENWYSDRNLKEFIPEKILRTVRPELLNDTVNENEQLPITGYTNCWIPAEKRLTEQEKSAWSRVLFQLDQQAGEGKSLERVNYDTWIADTRPIHCDNGKLYVAARNTFAVDKLTDINFTATALELLKASMPEISEIIVTVTEAE